MNSRRRLPFAPVWLVLLMVAVVAAECVPPAGPMQVAATVGLRAWLDQPPTGVTLPLAPYTLKAHARQDGGGVIEIDFKVNDILVGAVSTNASAELTYAETAWNPSAPGVYLIQAWAVNAQGLKVGSAVAVVCVADSNQQGCPQSVPDGSKPEVTPEATKESSPVTVSGPADIKIVAAPNPVYYGKCVHSEPDKLIFEAFLFPPETAVLEVDLMYNWLDSGGGAVGSPVAAQMAQIETGHYGYSIDAASDAGGILGSSDGSIEFRIIVLDPGKNIIAEYGPDRVSVLFCKPEQQPQVTTPAPQQKPTNTATSQPGVTPSATLKPTSALPPTNTPVPTNTPIPTDTPQPPTATNTPVPPDTTGPSVASLSASPKPALYGGSCAPGAAFVTFNVTVDDPSGISNVQIWYGYSTGGAPGAWWPATVSALGGGSYSATIDNNAGNRAYNALGGVDGTLYWYVLATDGASNTTNSGDQLMTIQICIG